MSATGEEAVALLRSIDATLKAMLALAQQRTRASQAGKAGAIASDRELDGKYGDPELKIMPRDWSGPSYKGRRLSELPPDLLDLVAEMFDYFASQAEAKKEEYKGKPVAPYRRSDAAKARGWAARIRAGKPAQTTTPANATESEWEGQDSWN